MEIHPSRSFEVAFGQSYQEVVDYLITIAQDHRHFLLVGDLGAGKTTLAKVFAEKAFGLTDLSSPTYNIIHLHPVEADIGYKTFAHIDLYRIESDMEFEELGGVEYLDDSECLCWIEWPDLAKGFLESYVEVEITSTTSGDRKIVVSLKTADGRSAE